MRRLAPRAIPFARLLLAAPLALACGVEEPANGTDRKSAGADPSPASATATEDPASREHDTPARHLHVWAADADRAHADFLAVLDVEPDSGRYGRLVATQPTGDRGAKPHHTEHRMPASGTLFANGYLAGRTYRFDLSEPDRPGLSGSFDGVASYTHPHSYERTPEGNVLITFQGQGPDNVDPGGLVEVTDGGELVRSASAADPARPDALLRPYSLAIVPELDRVVTTSYDMGEDMGFRGGRRGRTEVVQVWRLSDLSIVKTIDLPPGPKGYEDEQPGEPRLLADGRTVLVSTFACGLYRITDLDSDDPGAEWVHSFDGGGCAVPVVHGRWWIEPVPSAHALVSLDVSDPAGPVEADRLVLGRRNFPHWLALDSGGNRIVVADRGDGERRIFLVTIDPETGAVALDERFREAGSDRPGWSFDRRTWPHGPGGSAVPHGSVFGR